jgi:hypothetical protein
MESLTRHVKLRESETVDDDGKPKNDLTVVEMPGPKLTETKIFDLFENTKTISKQFTGYP